MIKFLENNKNYLFLSKIWKYIEVKNRRKVYIALTLMIISGICEIFTIATLIPFINILTSGEMIWQTINTKYLKSKDVKKCFHIYDERKEDGDHPTVTGSDTKLFRRIKQRHSKHPCVDQEKT